VKPSFGVHRKTHVEDLDESQQRSFLQWLDDLDDPHPSKVKEFERLKKRLHELITVAEEEAEEVVEREERRRIIAARPTSVITRLSPSAVKLFAVLYYLRAKHGRDPFPAPGSVLEEETGLSEGTIITAKKDLYDEHLLKEATKSEYHLLIKTSNFEVWPSSLSSLFSTKKKSQKKERETSIIEASSRQKQDAIKEAYAILKAPMLDRAARTARRKLDYLCSRGNRTLDDFYAVVHWARAAYDSGEQRFAPVLDLVYILDPSRFSGYLAAARTRPLLGKKFSANADEAWAATLPDNDEGD
jgi:hypothetical protein